MYFAQWSGVFNFAAPCRLYVMLRCDQNDKLLSLVFYGSRQMFLFIVGLNKHRDYIDSVYDIFMHRAEGGLMQRSRRRRSSFG